ncbi:hypothetical protein [Lacinutrix chionoecetis]
MTVYTSCKDSVGENVEEKMEQKSDDLEDRSDDIEDAADYVESGFNDIEDAIQNFKQALEEVDNPEDRKAIRKRINEIMDSIELSKK